MQTIKAEDLKVGMETEDGLTVVFVEHMENYIDVTYSVFDPDCGEMEYFPVQLSYEEEINIL